MLYLRVLLAGLVPSRDEGVKKLSKKRKEKKKDMKQDPGTSGKCGVWRSG